MDLQNFRMLQNFKYKEQKLAETFNKQKSILNQLRMEYESLKKDEDVKTTPADKLKQKKNLRSIYTFKLPVRKQKNKDGIETPERSRNGWIQRPLTELPHKIQSLNKQRSRMIELGNSYSENNRKCPLVTKTIRSVKTQHEMKYEMLNRAKLLGNHYSFRFRQHHQPKVYKKSIDSYKKHEHLINQKNEMEELFRSGVEVPQIFPQRYLHVLNEIYRLEEELNLNHQFSDGKICQEILKLGNFNEQRLIDQLSYPIFDDFDVVSDKIEMAKAMERIEIRKILEATNTVEQRISEELWIREDIEDVTKVKFGSKVIKNEAANTNDVEVHSKNEEIASENVKLESENSEQGLKFEELFPINEEKFNTKSLELDLKNEEIESINYELESKIEDLDLVGKEYSIFKDLILEISDEALGNINKDSSSTFQNNLKDNSLENQAKVEKIDSSPDTSNTFTSIFSQKLNTRLSETLKVFCENYIEDLFDIPNIPKHHPSFEDVRINFIHETTSNVDAGQENDDSQEISQVSHEICKSQSSILRTESVDSSKLLEMTSDALLDEIFIAQSSQQDETGSDFRSYSRKMTSRIKNPQSAKTILYN